MVLTMDERINQVYALRKQGYNCAQAVVGAYIDMFDGITFDQIMQLSCGFGGGIGGQQETCGAITGATMILGLALGKEKTDPENKAFAYQQVSNLCSQFKNKNDSIFCKELVAIEENSNIKKQKCDGYIIDAVHLLEKYI